MEAPQSTPSPMIGAALLGRLRTVGIADLVLALCVIGAIGLLIVKVPTWLMDILLVTNLSVSIVVLLVALLSPDARRLPAFPTVLLLTTLARLALNVSSTRLILLDADAGRVIEAFGRLVVGESIVVGGVVFLVLVVVQFVVIARGAERVAEVAARFTLDAMPGKQVSIDADVRAGLLTAEQASEKRTTLERENRLYGAMDGAMKFVKGDAIAGIVISLINIIGGLIIAKTATVPLPGLEGKDPFVVFPLLTIGDGLSAQIPSILVSIAAGLVVTRVASAENAPVGKDLAAQFLLQPKPLAIVGGLLFVLAATGFPPIPFLLLGFGCMSVAAVIMFRRFRQPAIALAEAPPQVRSLPAPVEFVVAASQAPAAWTTLRDALQTVAAEVSRDLGVVIPPPQVAAASHLATNQVAIHIFDAPAGVFDLPGASLGEAAPQLLARVLRSNAYKFASITATHQLLERVRQTEEGIQLVRAVTPSPLTLQQVAEVLQRLLREAVPVRQLSLILESLAKWGAHSKSPQQLTERCRRDLASIICARLSPLPGQLQLYTLAPELEDLIRSGVEETLEGQAVTLSIEDRRLFTSACKAVFTSTGGFPSVLLVENGSLRRAVKSVIERELPEVAVICYEEIPRDVLTTTLGVVVVPSAPSEQLT